MSFLHQPGPDARPASGDYAVFLSNGKILVREERSGIVLPRHGQIANLLHVPGGALHVGTLGKTPVWLHAAKEEVPPPEGLLWRETKPLVPLLDADTWAAVNCALVLFWWKKNHTFCGVCGTETVEVKEERALRCPNCGALFYPTQSPAVIVAVTKGDRILLAHNRNFRPGLNSLIAGFVDPGETFEAAVSRELREEVGIEIHRPHYVASQSWPFPNSLMIAFRAEWKSGEPLPDGKELETAAWYGRDNLPDLPNTTSIARVLIDAWLRG